MTTFGENLRAARKKLGMTQQALAHEIGAFKSGRMLIALWEMGKTQPNRDNLLKLLSFFHSKGIDFSFLLTPNCNDNNVVEKKE